MDSDFSHPPKKLIEMLKTLEEHDVVLGSRYVNGGSVDDSWPRWRKSLSSFGNFYARSILRLPVRDTTGGFRVWRRETLESMPLERIRSNGYAFQVEMTYVAYSLGFQFGSPPSHVGCEGEEDLLHCATILAVRPQTASVSPTACHRPVRPLRLPREARGCRGSRLRGDGM